MLKGQKRLEEAEEGLVQEGVLVTLAIAHSLSAWRRRRAKSQGGAFICKRKQGRLAEGSASSAQHDCAAGSGKGGGGSVVLLQEGGKRETSRRPPHQAETVRTTGDMQGGCRPGPLAPARSGRLLAVAQAAQRTAGAIGARILGRRTRCNGAGADVVLVLQGRQAGRQRHFAGQAPELVARRAVQCGWPEQHGGLCQGSQLRLLLNCRAVQEVNTAHSAHLQQKEVGPGKQAAGQGKHRVSSCVQCIWRPLTSRRGPSCLGAACWLWASPREPHP